MKSASGKSVIIAAQLPPELSRAVDLWLDEQEEETSSRSDLVRLALSEFLERRAWRTEEKHTVRWERGPQAPQFRRSVHPRSDI
jgi:Arc/MetJ-type ribon-helix-helix transcriptional regulator